jgi:serine protease Do
MKSTKLIPFIFLIASILLSACSGLGVTSLAAPAAAVASVPTAANSAVGTINTSTASQPSALAVQNQQTGLNAADLQSTYEAIYQNVNPSVVTIEISSQVTNTANPFGGQGNNGGQNNQDNQGQVVPTAEGSGWIWDNAGHIVTNNHVVEGSAKITVVFSDGSSYDAKVVGTDPNTDLAVIQVSGAPAALLKPITVGDSTQVKVGQLVIAIGNPFGLANTMTTGIVSAISRSISAGASRSQNSNSPSFSIPDAIQTDAAINPGNSGGVLVDLNGALIGVPSQIESASGSNSGVGFAIPSAVVKNVVPQLISKGSAAHSYLGISGGTLTADLDSQFNLKTGQQGILVATVVAGGPAEKAGIKAAQTDANGNPTTVGDIITAIEGKTITRFEDLVSYLFNNTQPGQTVTLTVIRDGKETPVKVTLGTQPTK